MKNVPVCTFKTSPFVLAPRAHVFQHVCAWCRYTRGRVEWTHGVSKRVTHTNTHINTHTTHHTTPHHTTAHHSTTQHNTTHYDHNTTRRKRERQRQTETEKEDRDRERREDSFLEWWCMAVFCWCSDLSGKSRLPVKFIFDFTQCPLAG